MEYGIRQGANWYGGIEEDLDAHLGHLLSLCI